MAAIGSLSARTFTAGMSVPLAGVSVTITSSDPLTPDLIAYRVTDEDGIIAPISLPTPELNLSLAPSDQRPFTICNMQFDHPQYYTILVRDVQVFPDSQSIQMMEMLPLGENTPVDRRGMTFTITPQNL